MYQIKIYCDWNLNVSLIHDRQVELYVNKIPSNKSNSIKFILLVEPPEIINLNNQIILGLKSGLIDYLLTHDENLLKYPNTYLFEFGSCWITDDYIHKSKKFEISGLVGGKTWTTGHLLRHHILNKINQINIPTKIYISSHYKPNIINSSYEILGSKKDPLFDSKFHFCIENVKRNNWFTEKLIDCLYTKTVPIYWGCPNIDNWFDTRGFIIVNDVHDLINKSNQINQNTYDEMYKYIENNCELSKNFFNFDKRVENKIKQILKKN